MRKINQIILHCSDSEWGDVEAIDKWHKALGWDGCGYHFVICNGRIASKYLKEWDGRVQEGRAIEKQGAHCKGENGDSIGICLIGKHHFTYNQLHIALPELMARLLHEYDLAIDDIHAHYEYSTKTCPNFDVDKYKEDLFGLISERLSLLI